MTTNLFDSFDKLGKGQFISIPAYVNSQGEVAKYKINGNINYGTLKENDHKKLISCTALQLVEIANENDLPFDAVLKAFSELVTASTKAMNGEKSVKSVAQSDAFLSLGNGLKLHKESRKFYIDGLINSKTVLIKGTPRKAVNSAPKTIAKSKIKKALEFQTLKYRSFIVETENCSYVNMSGTTVNV